MKLKFTRKTWYFFLLAAAAVSMLGGFAVLGGMDFSGLEMIVFCLTGIAVLFLAAQVKDLRQQAAGGWALYRYGSLFGAEAPALAEAECAALRALNG